MTRLRLLLPHAIPDWQERAACAGADTDTFYPGRYDTDWRAKHICDGCTVSVECLQYALDRGEQHGVWGGLNEKERRDLKRRAA